VVGGLLLTVGVADRTRLDWRELLLRTFVTLTVIVHSSCPGIVLGVSCPGPGEITWCGHSAGNVTWSTCRNIPTGRSAVEFAGPEVTVRAQTVLQPEARLAAGVTRASFCSDLVSFARRSEVVVFAALGRLLSGLHQETTIHGPSFLQAALSPYLGAQHHVARQVVQESDLLELTCSVGVEGEGESHLALRLESLPLTAEVVSLAEHVL